MTPPSSSSHVLPFRLAVSTTSVSPSQRPTESPCHNRMASGRCGTPVERNLPPRHALEEQHHVARRLQDVERRRRIDRARHAGHEAVRRGVVVAALGRLARFVLGPCPGLRRQHAVGRIDDEAAAAGREVGGRALFEPVVGAAVIGDVHAGDVRLAVGAALDGRGLRRRRRRGGRSARSAGTAVATSTAAVSDAGVGVIIGPGTTCADRARTRRWPLRLPPGTDTRGSDPCLSGGTAAC